jgi:hypothetical protein
MPRKICQIRVDTISGKVYRLEQEDISGIYTRL